MTRIALDASTLIYFVEGADALRERIARRLDAVRVDPSGQVVASRLARLECRVKPLRDNNPILLNEYEDVFGAGRFFLLDVTAAVLDRATDLRARHGFKVPDAILWWRSMYPAGKCGVLSMHLRTEPTSTTAPIRRRQWARTSAIVTSCSDS